MPHLGYCIDTNQPTDDQSSGKASGWRGRILKHPPLAKQIFRAPIPVTLFQDVHQEDFWEVGIRKFGLDLMKASTFTQHGSSILKI